jgi:HPt (histidine-containing phosphotransfer) domain-containing protein
MTSLPPADGRTTPSGRSSRGTWSPPPFLLETAAGDDGLIADLVDAFNTDTSVRIQGMRAALAASDFPKIRAAAHTINGGARQLGAAAVVEACQELEIASDLQEALLITARLNRVQEVFEEVCAAMAAYLDAQRNTLCRMPLL